MKMVYETQKIMNADIKVSVTTVRVPVLLDERGGDVFTLE